MDTRIEKNNGVCIVTIVSDQLDAGNARDFKERVNPVIDSEKNVVFDMSNVRFVDSSGLGAILSYLRRLHQEGGDLRLSGLTKPVRMLFELVRMHRIFEIYNTVDEAVRAFEMPEAKAALSAA